MRLTFRRVVGVLDFDDWVDVGTVAARLGITAATAGKWLAAVKHAGLVEHVRSAFELRRSP